MKDLLQILLRGGTLSVAQSEDAFTQIMGGTADPYQVAAFLTLLATRPPAVDELIGAATVMRRNVVTIPVPANLARGVIDTCGTGGNHSTLFNISTTAAIVVAACGVPVAKHGNKSVTSRSGSADVLRLLGVNVEAPRDVLVRCLTEAHICFAYAPYHHPAMKQVAHIRGALGFPTLFNLLGPLTNPAGARRQLVGVGSGALAEKILAVLVALGADRAMVVCGADAAGASIGELSIAGPTQVVLYDGQTRETRKLKLTPEDVGLETRSLAALRIETAADSAAIVRAVLAGEKGPARDIVLMNAGAALWVADAVDSIREGVTQAGEALDAGNAHETLEKWAAASHAASDA